jgi:crotonobetainyl-CoA:carnitine CoA-transferase CaiB-like acyl-CoA transferase
MAKLPALPLEFCGQRLGLRRQVPSEGVDADEVLAGMGLSTQQVAALREQKVIR